MDICKKTNILIYLVYERYGENKLKIVDYDSMSAGHVWVNPEMVLTSVRSGFVGDMFELTQRWF